MATISKLTKAQENAIPQYIQKWIDLASQPIDRSKLKDIIKKIYGKDKIVIIGDSFQNTIDLIRFATEGKKLEYDSQLHSQLHSQLDSQLHSQLDSQLYSQLDSQLHSQLDSQLDSQLYSQLDSQLYSQLDSQNIKWSYYVSYYLYGWAGYYDYAESIGVEFDKNSLKQYFDILLNIPIIIFIGDVIFVCEKPIVRWGNKLLHSDKFPAIGWKDVTGFYYLNGVNFPKELWEKVVSGTMPFAEIMAIEDIDQRTQAMKYGSVWDFIKHEGAQELDTFSKMRMDGTKINYWLYKFPKGKTFTTDAYYLIYDDIVPESTKQYMSGVPEFKTVADAMAWKFSDDYHTITGKQWKALMPGLHEN